jgi:hypothetical protein
MAKKQGKRQNGTGESLTVYFDKTDPQEARALEMSKLLAAKHGRRKDAIVALLSALYEVCESTGQILTPTDIINALNNSQSRSFTPAVGFSMPAPATQSLAVPVHATEQPRGVPGVTIVDDGPTGKMSGSQVAKNFLSNASSFFS